MSLSKSIKNYRLIEEDCISGMKEMRDESVDVIVTSPPYNLGINYGRYQDSLPIDQYLSWTNAWVKETTRLLKLDGSFFLNLGSSPSNPNMPFQVALEVGRTLRLQNTFHWIKSITVETTDGQSISAGHFKPINSRRFVTDCHEYVFHFTHSGNVSLNRLGIGVPYKDKSNIGRWKHTNGSDKRCRGNVWFIPYETITRRSEERPHPATFPIQLAKNCILLHSPNRPATVLDPFVGLGSTAIAASECGIANFWGFDMEPDYLFHAYNRLLERSFPVAKLNFEPKQEPVFSHSGGDLLGKRVVAG